MTSRLWPSPRWCRRRPPARPPAPPAVEAASPAPVEAASPALAAEVAAEEMGPLLGACYRCTCLVHEADIIERGLRRLK